MRRREGETGNNQMPSPKLAAPTPCQRCRRKLEDGLPQLVNRPKTSEGNLLDVDIHPNMNDETQQWSSETKQPVYCKGFALCSAEAYAIAICMG